MNFQPLGKRVLVERLEEATRTATGIIIPDSAKEKPSQGTIVAVGDKVKTIAEGDKVVFGKYVGNELSLDGKTYLILDAQDVLGIIK